MTISDLSSRIRVAFKSQVSDTRPSMVVQYDNHTTKPPEDDVWVRVSIMYGDSFKVENPGRFRTPGILKVMIFNTIGKGDSAQLELSGSIVEAFRNVTISSVTFRTPSVRTIGREENWWRIDAECPFYADDVEN